MSEVPTNPLVRGGRIARVGLQAGGNYLRHYVGNAMPGERFRESKEALNRKNALSLFRELSVLRGAALKLAQGLSLDTGVLPPEFAEVMANAQYRVPPMNRAMVRAQFQRIFGKPPEALFRRFDSEAFAAATIGQVHRAEAQDGQPLAVKIQYPNVRQSIESDLRLMKTLVSRLFSGEDLESHLQEVRERLLEETDYLREAEHLRHFRSFYSHPQVVVPELLSELSNERVLTMTRLEGKHLDALLQESPSQELRDQYGQILWEVFHDHLRLRHFSMHADIHPGNFLFQEGGRVGIIDFGCVKTFPEEFLESCVLLVQRFLLEDYSAFRQQLQEMRFLQGTAQAKERDDLIYRILKSLAHVVAQPYQSDHFDFGSPDFQGQLNEVFLEASQLREARGSEHFIFFNRIVFGLLSLLMKLKARVRTESASVLVREWPSLLS
ncbi:MAG: ABC1 kinase family protein [bacterium]|jgi:predicted unusual protein kinase regulating ubiquinone biosynthesis (AarF/ABC1/UbiB family)